MIEGLISQLSVINNSDIRLAFFDIDGTLIGSDGRYSESTKREINRIQACGIKTAIASGRPKFAAEFLIEELSINGAGLFSAGALLIDPSTNEVIMKKPLEIDGLKELVKFSRHHQMHCEIYEEDCYWVEHDSDIQLAHSRVLRSMPQTTQFDDLLSNEINPMKLLVGINEVERPGLLETMIGTYPQYNFALARMASHREWIFASIINKEIDRKKAFKQLCDYHKVSPEQVIAFGDAPSDLAFLEMAGVGVAMGNATPEVKSAANFVTLPDGEDGVAHALKVLVPR